MENDTPITVFVVDDHILVREGLTNVINLAPDLQVVADGNGDAETLRVLTRSTARVLVIDLEMPSIRGPTFIAMAKEAMPELGVVACTMHGSYGYLSEALGHGATGYVLKSSSSDLLIEAIRAAAAGRGFIDPALQGEVVRLVQGKIANSAAPNLTSMELRVLRFAADGLTNPEIGVRVGQSVESVKLRLRRAFRKLGAKDRASAVASAIRRGLI
jgi:DNA-binding NarL/FixJ family response regulator